MIASGEVDAQENPLANTFTYGVGAHHPHLTRTGHLYGARATCPRAQRRYLAGCGVGRRARRSGRRRVRPKRKLA